MLGGMNYVNYWMVVSVEGLAAGGGSSGGNGSVENFRSEGGMEGAPGMAEDGTAMQRVFVVEAVAGGASVQVMRVEELEAVDVRRTCRRGPSNRAISAACLLKETCDVIWVGCIVGFSPYPNPSGWYLGADEHGMITCQEYSFVDCPVTVCYGNRYDSRERCEGQCYIASSNGSSVSGDKDLGSSNIAESASAPGPSGGALMLKLGAVWVLAWAAGIYVLGNWACII